ncbi:helix-turn-helix transcriptional regulator [Nonomuraea endophytica]|uniref:helix-turn-helix transcriptional regulator n=1 Tax=Nonomuraea endophytica TaxID=714136 RepID=UPI0037CB6503
MSSKTERIDDVQGVNELLWELSREAGEVLAVHHSRRQVPGGRLPGFIDRLRTGVSWRTIVPRALLDDPASAAYCRQLHQAGDRHRVTDDSVQQMIVLDRKVAFVPTMPDTRGAGALVIRDPGTVATVADLFERVWTHAVDLETAYPPVLLEHQVQILRLMTTVAKDDIAARELGLSLRTYRRHVASVLAALDVPNRVQAAVVAQRRGWI